MRSVSRKFRKIVVGALVLLVACVVTTFIFLDAVAARVVAEAGTRVLAVQTTVRSVHLGLFDGSSSLDGLAIAQPSGFGDGSMITVESASISAGMSELLSQDIQIDSLEIHGIVVRLVQRGDQVNLQVVAANVVGADDRDAQAEQSSKVAESTRTVQIRRLSVSGIKVIVTGDSALMGSKPVEVEIPDFVVTDVGTKTSVGDIAAQLSTQLMDHLIVAIVEAKIQGLPASMMSGLQSAAKSLSGELKELLESSGDVLKKTLEGAGDAIKGLFEK